MILLTHQRPSQGDAVTIQMPFTADLSMPPVFLTRNARPLTADLSAPSLWRDPVAEPRRQKNKRAHYSADLSAPCVARARASAPIVSAVASGLLAKTRSSLRGRRPQQQHHHQRSPRTPELHRRPQPDSLISTAQPSTSPSCGQQPLHRPGGSSRSVRSRVALIAGRSADRRRWLGAPLAFSPNARPPIFAPNRIS